MDKKTFFKIIKQGIPEELPPAPKKNSNLDHAPAKKHNLSVNEKKLALQNALRYFPKNFTLNLSMNFLKSLKTLEKYICLDLNPNTK